MLAGSDSLDVFNYPGSSLHQELKLLVDAGLTPLESQQTATSNPARFFGRDQPGGFGRIAPGYLADLVILEANPLEDITNSERMDSVMLGGKLLDRPTLDRLLAKARASATAASP